MSGETTPAAPVGQGVEKTEDEEDEDFSKRTQRLQMEAKMALAQVNVFILQNYNIYRVPTRTGKPGKPGKMGRHFPVREKSGNFEQTGKVREKSGKTTQNTGKLR